MSEDRMRTLGLVGGGAALLAALGLATLGHDKPVPPAEAPPAVVAAEPSAGAVAPIASPPVETAMAEAPPPAAAPKDAPPANPNLEFIVRFDDRHPLSRAQALYLQGKHADAETLARETLARHSEFSGLCFSRFTLGAEIVLAHCARVPASRLDRTSDRWSRKLRAMRGVQYADPNVIVAPERR